MNEQTPLYLRQRTLTQAEMNGIPWLQLLSAKERERITANLKISEARPGEYVCRVGRPVTYWIGVIDGLLKMSADNAQG